MYLCVLFIACIANVVIVFVIVLLQRSGSQQLLTVQPAETSQQDLPNLQCKMVASKLFFIIRRFCKLLSSTYS